MKFEDRIKTIIQSHGGIIETKLAADNGISKAMLSKLCKQGRLLRIARGQYILPDDVQDELLSISLRSQMLIFSHETALFLHEKYLLLMRILLTNSNGHAQFPLEYQIILKKLGHSFMVMIGCIPSIVISYSL